MANAKRDGQFTKTDYSSFLLGTRCLDTHDPNKEKIIEELYASNFIKVQHGIFATLAAELKVGEQEETSVYIHKTNQMKVAEELALLFNKNPRLRDQVRLEWMEHLSYTPHTETGEFIACYLCHECEFLISEYLKHGPGVGLSIAEYIDFTSILFNHCNPVESLGEIDEKKHFAKKNPFSKESLSSQLVSPPDLKQPIPKQVVCECNAGHYCMLIEVRYKFEWQKGNLVNRAPNEVFTRIDHCEKPDEEHKIYYLTQRDRKSLKKCIEEEKRDVAAGKKNNIPVEQSRLIGCASGAVAQGLKFKGAPNFLGPL